MKKLYFIATALFLTITSVVAQDTVLRETFGVAQLPSGWQNIDRLESGGIWDFENLGQREVTTTTATNGFAILDSDNYGGDIDCDADLVSPKVSLLAYDSTVTLTFSMFFNSAGDPPLPFPATDMTGFVDISNDGGMTFTNVVTYDIQSTDGNMNGIVKSYNVSAQALGKGEVVVRFHFVGNFQQYWAVDDVYIIGLKKKASQGTNTLPNAMDDNATTEQNTLVNINVLSNDSDPDGSVDATSVKINTNAKNGIGTVNTNGSIDYTPNSGFFGLDTLYYTIKDNKGGESSTAKVIIEVIKTAGNAAPNAKNDNSTTNKGTNVTINVIGNDTDADGTVDPTSIVMYTTPQNGTALVNNDGTITYTPNASFVGADSLLYTIKDDMGAESNQAKVVINVIGTTTVGGIVAQKLSIYPNPTNGNLYIKDIPTNTVVKITDINGNVQACELYNNGLPVSSLANGTYFIQAFYKNQYYTASFIKQ